MFGASCHFSFFQTILMYLKFTSFKSWKSSCQAVKKLQKVFFKTFRAGCWGQFLKKYLSWFLKSETKDTSFQLAKFDTLCEDFHKKNTFSTQPVSFLKKWPRSFPWLTLVFLKYFLVVLVSCWSPFLQKIKRWENFLLPSNNQKYGPIKLKHFRVIWKSKMQFRIFSFWLKTFSKNSFLTQIWSLTSHGKS